MKIKFSHSFKNSNLIRLAVIFTLTAANMLVWLAHYVLVRTDGFYTNITGHPALPFVYFIIPAILLICTAHAENAFFSFAVSVPAALVLSVLLAETGTEVYRHFENSVLLKNERFETEQISLDELEKVSSGNYIVFVGRPDCNYSRDAYDMLCETCLQSPLQLHYYNTSADRKTDKDRMLEVLAKYDIEIVPAVVFFVDGKADKTIFYREIASGFYEYIDEYARRNVYFNKKLSV